MSVNFIYLQRIEKMIIRQTGFFHTKTVLNLSEYKFSIFDRCKQRVLFAKKTPRFSHIRCAHDLSCRLDDTGDLYKPKHCFWFDKHPIKKGGTIMKQFKRTWYCLLIGLVAIFIGANPGFGADIPKIMTWTSYDVGSSGYMMVGHVATTLFEKHGVKVRIIPAGTDIPRVYPVRLKGAEVAFHGLGSWLMQEGLRDYASSEWGPQPVRALYFAQHPGLSLGIRGDSPIKSWKDIKGKKIATFPGSGPLTLISEVHLAYAGLTWDDVIPVKAAGYGASIKMVMSGKIDATHINPTASLAYQMEAKPHGIRFIELPHDLFRFPVLF